MTLRIVLSILLIAFLALVAACVQPQLDDVADHAAAVTEPGEANGIGTSPSAASLPTYGIWVDSSVAAADARALAGEPPDVILEVLGHTDAADALAMAAWWPGQHVVREVRLRPPKWAAVQAP